MIGGEVACMMRYSVGGGVACDDIMYRVERVPRMTTPWGQSCNDDTPWRQSCTHDDAGGRVARMMTWKLKIS